MAVNQAKRHELGRAGERVANGLVGGKKTTHKAPFDIVDFKNGFAYEVKTMHGHGDLKVHISSASMRRKREFAQHYGLQMRLIVVIIWAPDRVDVYGSELKGSIRVIQMELISTGGAK